MSLPEYDVLLQISAVVTTIFQYLSGAVVCRKYVKKKSTGESSGFPFMCGFLSCSFWMRYGMLANEDIVVLVNSIGATLFFIYTLIYYVFTVNKAKYLKEFSLILLTLFVIFLYTNLEQDTAMAVYRMGVICCVVTVGFYAAPLTILLHVIRTKNSESLPFPLIVTSFLVSVQWLIYGVIISDTFIQLPNFFGCLLSLFQLCLFVCYPPKSVSGPSYKLIADQSTIY